MYTDSEQVNNRLSPTVYQLEGTPYSRFTSPCKRQNWLQLELCSWLDWPTADSNIDGFTQLINYVVNTYAPSVAPVCFNRKILLSFPAAHRRSPPAARAGSSNRKQNVFRRLRHLWNFSTSLVELFFVENLWKRSDFTYFRTFLNIFGQNEWQIRFSQPILR